VGREEEWYTFRDRASARRQDADTGIETSRAEPFGQDGDGNPNCDYAEFLPDGAQTVLLDQLAESAQQQFRFEPKVVPVREQEGDPPVWVWRVRPNQLGYILGPVAVAPLRDRDPLPVEIDALVYAQNGS
jgi:hypothetical protein